MDIKSETYHHLAILACTRPQAVATPKNNIWLRKMLYEHGSFEEAYKRLRLSPSIEVKEKLEKVEKSLSGLTLDYKISSCLDLDFPVELKDHENVAPVIYYRGNLKLLNGACIAVVGTRNPLTKTELEDANKVLEDLIKKNYVIVSGLAKGCDTLGHYAGLKSSTVGVIGTSIDKSYPSENAELQERIAREHLLVSQFPIGLDRFLHYRFEQPLNFKKRNQTTVVLANKGVLVLKTADKGGTQNAITESQKFSRALYALRGNFEGENTWTNNFNWEDFGLVRKVK